MQQQEHEHYNSSSPSLSSPPSALSEPGSPTRVLNAGRANIEMDEIIVEPSSVPRFAIMQQHQPAEQAPSVPLTAAGLPRKKPGRKPGSTVKPKPPADGSPNMSNADAPKQRRPRKPKDPNAPPVQRKRKAGATEAGDANSEMDARSASGPPRQTKIAELNPMRMDLDARSTPTDIGFAPTAPKRESASGSMNMMNLLNEEPQPKPQPAPPTRQMFDPIRGNYDPIRESVATRDPYGTGPHGSPRAPTQVVNRASASPSIASLVDPQPAPNAISPRPAYTTATSQPRYQDSTSMSPSPSDAVRNASQSASKPTTTTTTTSLTEAKRPPPPPPAPPAATTSKPAESKANTSFTSMASAPSATSSAPTAAPTAAAATTAPATAQPAAAPSKKIAAVVQQERESQKKARSSSSSSPKLTSLKDALPPLPGGERSILDFGKARPGEETEAPNITLHIPLNPGECNKYVNFMRMAEERYGWDALHPRLAASRERRARIAAATAALEKTGSGRDSSAEEMEEDILQGSDGGESNAEMQGNGTGAPAKPAKKKRNFKEDEYDKDDDFVDDSELLWEEQAAASRDGFFVYMGPLIPEVEKPAGSEERPRRGRGGRGRGSRGGGTVRSEGGGSGRGRGGGGPGSRGGTVRKPRTTKVEKEHREKVEREKLAQLASAKTGADSPASSLLSLGGPSSTQGATPSMAM
ncbi:hypothetical protein VTH82DRAFT_6401 [Thermothelomyces myriococcoides]